MPLERLCRDLDFAGPDVLVSAVTPARRPAPARVRPALNFDPAKAVRRLSVRQSLAGKHLLLIGVTGFIGKVWLANLLIDLPEIAKIYLLVRPQRATSGLERFEKIVEESPVFEPLYRRYGERLAEFMRERVEVIEGDVSQPGLGMEPAVRERLAHTLDVVINSSGLTDFNPDLRDAHRGQRGFDPPPDRVPPPVRTTPLCCTFPRATWSASWMDVSQRSSRPTTRHGAFPAGMPRAKCARCGS